MIIANQVIVVEGFPLGQSRASVVQSLKFGQVRANCFRQSMKFGQSIGQSSGKVRAKFLRAKVGQSSGKVRASLGKVWAKFGQSSGKFGQSLGKVRASSGKVWAKFAQSSGKVRAKFGQVRAKFGQSSGKFGKVHAKSEDDIGRRASMCISYTPEYLISYLCYASHNQRSSENRHVHKKKISWITGDH